MNLPPDQQSNLAIRVGIVVALVTALAPAVTPAMINGAPDQPTPSATARIFLPVLERRGSSPPPSDSTPQRLTARPTRDWQPTVSPDGTRIVYVSQDAATGRGQLRVVGIDGRGDAPIALEGLAYVDRPTFTPDGQAVVVAARPEVGAWELYEVTLADGSRRALTDTPQRDERRPSLGPDGRWLVFDADVAPGNTELFRLERSTGAVTQLTTHPGNDRLATVTRSGHAVLFRSERAGDSEVYRLVLADDGAAAGAPLALTDHPAYDGYADVSPDDETIVFQSTRGGGNDVFAMNPDGWQVRRLTDGAADWVTPAYTPDGQRLVVAGDATGDYELYVIPADGRAAGPPISVIWRSQIGGMGVLAVDARASLAVAGLGPRLVTLDVSSPDAPQALGSVALDGFPQDVVLTHEHALVALGEAGVAVVEITQPLRPRVTGSLATEAQAVGLAVDGPQLYVAAGPDGLRVADVRDPGAPRWITTLDTDGDARGVAVAAQRAYVADGPAGLLVVDIAQPHRPQPLATLPAPGGASAVAVDGQQVYVGEAGLGLRVLAADGARPTPREIGRLGLDAPVYDIAVRDGRVVLALADRGLAWVDAANPARPREIERVDTPGEARAVALEGDVAIVADRGAVQLVGLSDTNGLLGRYGQPWQAQQVAGSAETVYAGSPLSDLRAIDVRTPAEPSLVGRHDIRPHGLAMRGEDTLLATADRSLHTFSTRHPAALESLDRLELPGEATAIAVGGGAEGIAAVKHLRTETGYRYWDLFHGIALVDISAPRRLRQLTNLEDAQMAGGVIQNGRWYVADRGELRILDIRSPETPAVLGALELPGDMRDVAVAGGLVLVAARHAGLHAVEVSDPSSPRLLGQARLPGEALAVAVDGLTAYVAAFEGGLRVVDLTDPRRPVEIDQLETPGEARDVLLAGALVHVADGSGGLVILSRSD